MNAIQLQDKIDATYQLHKGYDVLCNAHKDIIYSVDIHLIDVNYMLPEYDTEVFAIQDLTPIGKGVFIGEYFYNEHGFCSDIYADDAYGYITHWFYKNALG